MYIIYTQCRIARSEISFLDGELRKLHTKLMLSREHSHAHIYLSTWWGYMRNNYVRCPNVEHFVDISVYVCDKTT